MSEKSTETAEKPGFKTSEFWLTLAVMIIGALMASGAFGDDSTAMRLGGMALATMKALGYTASRGKAKFGASLERAAKKQAAPE